jgi:hypothetical protein
MKPARPLLFLLLAGFAISVTSADEAQAQTSLASLDERTFDQPSGLILSVGKAATLRNSPNADPPLAKLDNGVCYTMRMYKLKRTERISEGEKIDRGYTTCEMASNYQFRSAIVHARGAEAPTTSGGK